jgi:hypothetical protein
MPGQQFWILSIGLIRISIFGFRILNQNLCDIVWELHWRDFRLTTYADGEPAAGAAALIAKFDGGSAASWTGE